jgi:hypothetical protein
MMEKEAKKIEPVGWLRITKYTGTRIDYNIKKHCVEISSWYDNFTAVDTDIISLVDFFNSLEIPKSHILKAVEEMKNG